MGNGEQSWWMGKEKREMRYGKGGLENEEGVNEK